METTFTVQISIPTSLHVRIVGNIPGLGEWWPLQSRRMKRSKLSNEVASWTTGVVASDIVEYEYRYLVCDELCGDAEEQFVIVKVGPSMKCKASKEIDDGCLDAANWVDGWIIHETEVHLTVHNADCHPIILLPGITNQESLHIRVSKLKNDEGILLCESDTSVITKVVGDCYSSVEKQNETGICYNPSLHYTFVSHVSSINDAFFKIELYSSESSCVGCGHILPINLSGSCGILDVVISRHQSPVGSIKVEYLLIKPLGDPSLHNLANWSDRVWQGNGETLLMGHRGCGSTFSSAQRGVPENTIESFMLSMERGDDGLELDVHLTKDFQPVIYHDLDTNACLITKDGGKLKRSFQVHELTYKELQEIKLELTACDELNSEINSQHVERNRMIAPRLVEVLKALPEEFPMELEVKYIETEKGKKDDPYLDVNEYIDVILKTVLQNIGKRKIILMSFSPIIVQLMHRKQRQIPVKIAVCGDTPKYPVYRDIRIRSVGRIIGFAASQGILGVSSFNECILNEPGLIKELKSRGLILSTWGKSNNFEEIREKQKVLGVDVICYDRKMTPS